ncbi:Glu/Leu/Phe/Val dehydrogenase [soil metagenome]
MLTLKENVQEAASESGVFSQIDKLGHEQIVFCQDKETGLKSIIAIHNTTLGPALGGTRFYNYKSEADALRDVLRLSRGMSYKNSISGIHLGGGKAVIIGDPAKLTSEAFWRRYGKFVNSLNGKYYTAEDVGTSTADMEYVSLETKFVAGKPEYLGGGGDPSPFTAYGVYLGMKAAAKKAYGSDSLARRKILVEGVGHVGAHLVDYLVKEDAVVYVTDINEKRLLALENDFPVTIVPTGAAYDLDINIYAPCAMGATLNTETIDRLKCQVIAGAANNQLEDEQTHGQMLIEKGIVYAPDFLINAGGVINCYMELDGYSRERAMAGTERIYDRTLEIFAKAEAEGITTQAAAIKLAEERIEAIGKLKAK